MIKNIIFGNKDIVPVVMFHSVGAEHMDWVFNYISEPYENFESKIKFLDNAGFNFITWTQLYGYMMGEIQLKTPAILLTFDDGYLDNWVNVYPLLKKYNARCTIFVSTDFIDPSTECRFNTDDVEQGRCAVSDLDIKGFLNWNEMKVMEDSGVVDIQSHAASHTWYFKSNKVIDFWGVESNKYPWIPWNKNITEKPFYMKDDQSSFIKSGTPIYEFEKSLLVTQFFPHKNIAKEMVEYVINNGGNEFFKRSDWKNILTHKHAEVFDKYKLECQYETITDRRNRMYYELSQSKSILEENLDKKIDFICWPGGGYDQLTLDVAVECGFKSWTLGSSDSSDFRNLPGANPVNIKRIGSAIKQSWRGHDLGFTSGREFYYGVLRHQGSTYHKWLGRSLRLYRVIMSVFKYES